MKNILTLLFVFITFAVTAQTKLVPGDSSIETKWIKNEKYQMKWFVLRGPEKFEVAKINTEVKAGTKELSIISSVDVIKATTKWIDSTITALPTLKPIRHYSDNLERGVSLKFGETIIGKYDDKVMKKKVVIDEAITGEYFDSNFYPYLVRLLPLKEGYTKEVSAYDYGPTRQGLFSFLVKGVKSGSYKTKKGAVPVWIVTSVEIIKGQRNDVSYYIAKSDRKLWKMEVFDGVQQMLLERTE